jgi:hypothetical protein
MQSKNKPQPTQHERAHIARVRQLQCSLCDLPGPSECHEIEQGQWFTSIALCPACHRGPLGWHGTKALWRIRKLSELAALNITLDRMMREIV